MISKEELEKLFSVEYEYGDEDEEEYIDTDIEDSGEQSPLPLGIVKGNFREELRENQKKRLIEETEGTIKEIIVIKESQTGVVQKYLESLRMDGFKYFEGNNSFKLISTLRENLLDDPYWVIATTGRNSLAPKKLKYNHNVLQKYVNHIIISNNWGIINEIDKKTFTVDMDFGDAIYKYKVKFISTLGDQVLRDYVSSKLENIMGPMELERVQATLFDLGRKNIVENVERFVQMKDYSVEDVIKSIEKEKNITYEINGLVKSLTTKKGTSWKKVVRNVLEVYGEKYLFKVLKNNVEGMYQIKMNGEWDGLSKNFMESYSNNVDLLDLIYLQSVLTVKKIEELLLELDRYMNNSTEKLILE